MSHDQRAAETTSSNEFQSSLRILDGSNSWFTWNTGLMIVLLPVVMALFSFSWPSAELGTSQSVAVSTAGALLLLLWMTNVFTLYRQRRRLMMLRSGLVQQMDAATKHRVRAEKFYGLSILDPLTGLYNRRFGETRLQEEITRAEKSGDPLLVLALDFDHFKEINDQCGHGVGDLALKTFSRRLQRAIRACDVPIRVGGDEFLVILPECPPDKVQLILSRMASFELNVEGRKICVSFSRGVAQYQLNDTPESMIRRADERLYAAKAKRASVEV
jgi:diguanylate cyclase (GGDEF)-like protein